MSTPGPAAVSGRLDAIDWLRGVGLILIVLSHGWALWWTERLESTPVLLTLMQSGNLGVTVFLVVAGFLLTRSLIGREGTRADDSGEVGPVAAERPVRAVATRWLRLSSQVYPLLLAVLVVAWLDSEETLTGEQSVRSAAAVATYTWNWYLQNASPVARPDLGHLWYTAVYLQVTVLLVILVRCLRHRRGWLIATLAALLLACILWRSHVVDSEGPYLSLLRTTTRMDGMLWGALLALAWPWTRRLRAHGATLAAWGLFGFLVLTLTLGNSMAYMGWGGIAANVVVTMFVLGGHSLPRGPLQRSITLAPVVWLGRHSLSLYVWHYPVFFFVARHVGELSGLVKGLAASGLVLILASLTTRWVERPLARRAALWLDRSRTAPP